MSRARRRGLVRLVVLIVIVGWLVILAAKDTFTGGSGGGSKQTQTTKRVLFPRHLRAVTTDMRLSEPLHGATAASTQGGILVIGGADRNDVSSDRVLLLEPSQASVARAGTLAQPLHDAAAVTLGDRTLVFGGGASTTLDTIQRLVRGGTAVPVGHLPDSASDLSAAGVGASAYVVGGYDGRSPLGSVLRTQDGSHVATVGSLRTPVRYPALATLGGSLYAFGGELATGADTDLIQSYDTETGRSSVVGRLPRRLAHASAVVLDGGIYVLGGRRSGVASDQILHFDPVRRTVAPAGKLPAPVFDAAVATEAGVAYLAGGIGPAGTSVDSVVSVRP